MRIKDVLKKFGVNKNKMTNDDYVVEDCDLELCINDDLLAVTLGQWMGMLYDSTKSSNSSITVYTTLEPKEYLKKYGISYEDKCKIEKRFANIISKAGFPDGGICVIDDFDSKNNTFGATFFHSDDEPKFKIRFGTWLENGPELTVIHNNLVNLYNVWMGNKDIKDKVVLDYSIKKLGDDNNKLARSISQFSYRASLFNSNYKVNVVIEYPKTLDLELGFNPMVNEELMEQILSNVEIPMDIQDLTDKISKALKLSVNLYPSISISIAKVLEDNKSAVTDEVKFKNGNFASFKITRNGKTISIDEFDSWSYVTDTYSIMQSTDKNISYGFNSISAEQIQSIPAPNTLVSDANQDVEEVKGIALSLLKK